MTNCFHYQIRERVLRWPALMLLMMLTLFAVDSTWAIPIKNRTLMRRVIPFAPIVEPNADRQVLMIFKPTDDADDAPHMVHAMLHEVLFRTKAATLHRSDDANEFDDPAAVSEKFDAVIFINDASELFATKARRDSLMQFLEQGKGIVFLHDGIRTADGWLEMQLIAGGRGVERLDSVSDSLVEVIGVEHQINQHFDSPALQLSESLLALSEGSVAPIANRLLLLADTTPVSWIRVLEQSKARVFCSTLGSDVATYFETGMIGHWLAGLQFACGDLAVDTVPSAELAAAPETLAGCLQEIASEIDDVKRHLRSVAAGYVMDGANADETARTQAEGALVALLQTEDASIAAKRFACRQLRLVGGESALPTLMALLDDPLFNDVIVDTLATFADVDELLGKMVRDSKQTSVKRAAGLAILGQRQCSDLYEEAQTEYLQSEDAELRRAGIRYVGKIGPNQQMQFAREMVRRYLETDDEEDGAAYAEAVIDFFIGCNGISVYGSVFSYHMNADKIVSPREAHRAGAVAKVLGGYRGSEMIYFMGASDDADVVAVMEEVLSNWPDGLGNKASFALATQSKHEVDQEPLIRAFVRLMSEMQGYEPYYLATAFRGAFLISRWDDVDLEIMRVLAFVPDPVTLEMAQLALESRSNLQVRRTAVRVVALVTEKIGVDHREISIAALTEALEFIESGEPDNEYRERLEDVLAQLQ